MKAPGIFSALIAVMLTGCVQSYEGGAYDRDAYPYGEEHPPASSLIEVTFGDGETRVTKNVPADAVNAVGDAVRSARDR